MGLDHVFADFLTRTALGAATVLAIILLAGFGIRRSSAAVRRSRRYSRGS